MEQIGGDLCEGIYILLVNWKKKNIQPLKVFDWLSEVVLVVFNIKLFGSLWNLFCITSELNFTNPHHSVVKQALQWTFVEKK